MVPWTFRSYLTTSRVSRRGKTSKIAKRTIAFIPPDPFSDWSVCVLSRESRNNGVSRDALYPRFVSTGTISSSISRGYRWTRVTSLKRRLAPNLTMLTTFGIAQRKKSSDRRRSVDRVSNNSSYEDDSEKWKTRHVERLDVRAREIEAKERFFKSPATFVATYSQYRDYTRRA